MSASKIVFVIALFGLLIYLPGLNRETGLTGMDEYYVSLRVPIEMLEKGQYITPYLEETPRFQKPPLLYWLILLNYKIFGISLMSARIWGVLFGIALAIIAGLISRHLWKEQTGLAPALVVLTSAGISVQTRMALLDLPLAFFVTLSIYLFLLWKEKGKRIWLLASAGVCGLSVMTKGPVGPLLASSAILLNLILFRDIRNQIKKWRDWLWAAVVFLLVAIPWPLAMVLIWEKTFLDTLVTELITSRFARYSTGPSVVLGGFFALLLPWSLLYLGASVNALRQGFDQENRKALWLLGWCLLFSLPFLLLRLKFERYLLATIPPAAILVCVVPYKSMFWRSILFKGTAILFGFAGLFVILFGFWFKVASLWMILLLLTLSALFCILLWGQKKLTTAAAVIGLYYTVLFGLFYPGIGIHATPPELLSLIKSNPYPVYYFKGNHPAFLPIHLKKSVQQIKDSGLLSDLAGKGLFVIVEEKLERDFRETARRAELKVPEPALRFGTFYSRVAWVRFPREDVTWDDWKQAIKDRSLRSLQTEFRLYFLHYSGDRRMA